MNYHWKISIIWNKKKTIFLHIYIYNSVNAKLKLCQRSYTKYFKEMTDDDIPTAARFL